MHARMHASPLTTTHSGPSGQILGLGGRDSVHTKVCTSVIILCEMEILDGEGMDGFTWQIYAWQCFVTCAADRGIADPSLARPFDLLRVLEIC